MGIEVFGPGVYIPQDVLSTEQVVNLKDNYGNQLLKTSVEWIVKNSGIHERRIEFEKSTPEMGIAAVENLSSRLEQELRPQEIIFATNFHSGVEFPSFANQVSKYFGWNASGFDLGAGCAGLMYALKKGHDSLIADEDVSQVLVIGAEKLSAITNYADRKTCFLFGDGAGAYLLEKTDANKRLSFVPAGKDDVGSEKFPKTVLSTSHASMHRLAKSSNNQRYFAVANLAPRLIMDGNPVFKYATTVMPNLVERVAEKHGVVLEDIDIIFPHSANKRIIDYAERVLEKKGFQGEMYSSIACHGNTSTASIPLSMNEALREGKLKENMLVCGVSFGAGLNAVAGLYRFS